MRKQTKKPCEIDSQIRCRGNQGTCFGWVYFDLPYGKKVPSSARTRAIAELAYCPYERQALAEIGMRPASALSFAD